MRYSHIALAITLLTIAMPGFADYQGDEIPPPNINAYIAQPPPKPSKLKLFFDHIYVNGILGTSFVRISKIRVDTQGILDNGSEAAKVTQKRNFEFNKGFGIGYIFKPVGNIWLNRIGLEYMLRNKIKYDANPPFTLARFADTTLSSKIDSQTFMAQWYSGFKINRLIFIPFFTAGVGMSRNSTQTKAFYKQNNLTNGVNSEISTTTHNLAWDLGLGGTYPISSHFSVSAFYEYVNLGKLKWTMDANSGAYTKASLSTNSFKAHTVNLSLNIRL